MTRQSTSVVDWDNTLHRGFTVLKWLKFLGRELGDQAGYARTAAETVAEWRHGVTSYEAMATRVVRVYWAAASGIPSPTLERLAADFVAAGLDMMPFAKGLLGRLKDFGAVVIVSGAPKAVVETAIAVYKLPVTQVLALPDYPTSFHDEFNIALPDVKAAAVAKFSDVVFAVGDSVADVPLFAAARMCLVVDNSELAESLSERYGRAAFSISSTDSSEHVSSLIERLASPKGDGERWMS